MLHKVIVTKFCKYKHSSQARTSQANLTFNSYNNKQSYNNSSNYKKVYNNSRNHKQPYNNFMNHKQLFNNPTSSLYSLVHYFSHTTIQQFQQQQEIIQPTTTSNYTTIPGTASNYTIILRTTSNHSTHTTSFIYSFIHCFAPTNLIIRGSPILIEDLFFRKALDSHSTNLLAQGQAQSFQQPKITALGKLNLV